MTTEGSHSEEQGSRSSSSFPLCRLASRSPRLAHIARKKAKTLYPATLFFHSTWFFFFSPAFTHALERFFQSQTGTGPSITLKNSAGMSCILFVDTLVLKQSLSAAVAYTDRYIWIQLFIFPVDRQAAFSFEKITATRQDETKDKKISISSWTDAVLTKKEPSLRLQCHGFSRGVCTSEIFPLSFS